MSRVPVSIVLRETDPLAEGELAGSFLAMLLMRRSGFALTT